MEYSNSDGLETDSPENYCAIRILFALTVIKNKYIHVYYVYMITYTV